jgi:hypothetical protein
VTNVVNIVLAMLTAGLLASGCIVSASGVFDCTHSWINPVYTAGAIGVVSAFKVVVSLFTGGFAGLIAPPSK